MVPVLVHTPPSIRSRSMTATVLPSLAAARAAFCPPGPEPMTIMSYSSIEPMRKHLRRFVATRMPSSANRHLNNQFSCCRRSRSRAAGCPQLRLCPQRTGCAVCTADGLTVPIASVGAMTKQRPDFELNRPGAVIAALPAVLGFVPEKSLGVISIDDGELGSVMRVELSEAP